MTAQLQAPPRIVTPDAVACDHLAVVECAGRDAAGFLHGQLSNDIAGLGIGGCALSAYLNPKGRILGLVRALRTAEESFLLLLADGLADAVSARLRMFVMRSKVTFTPRPELAVFGLTRAAAATLGAPVPDPGRAVEVGENSLLATPGPAAERMLLITMHDAAWLRERLDVEVGPGTDWLAAEAVDGVPEVFSETAETFLPQAINLDLVGGVSFRKGCYPGQEIVARLRYLGKLKQRMVGFTADCPAPAAGSAVTLAGRRIGTVVSAAAMPSSGVIGLASITFADLGEEPVRLADGTVATLFAPPYAIPEFAADE